jgi:hypothetical protein
VNSLRCLNCSFLNFATATACKRCGLPFEPSVDTSSAGAEWDSQTSSAIYPPPPADNSHLWGQPTYQPAYVPHSMAKSSDASLVIKIFVAVAVIGLVAFLSIPVLLKNKRANFTNLNWTQYDSPDGKFSVSLPVAPKISERAIPTPLGNAQSRMLEAQVTIDGGCMVLYADYPVQQSDVSEEEVYEMAVQGAAGKQRKMVIGAQKKITLDGYQGMELELKPGDTTLKVTGSMRLFWVSPRLYVVGTGGPDTAEFKAVQARCLDSFRLHGSR